MCEFAERVIWLDPGLKLLMLNDEQAEANRRAVLCRGIELDVWQASLKN